MKKYLINFTFLLFVACSSSSNPFTSAPAVIGVDSTNDRLFVLEDQGVLSILVASSLDEIGDQPVVDDETLEDIYAILPTAPTNMAVIASGSTSRIFVSGVQDGVTNRILVLDFDGTTLSEASFSPMIVEDSDAATDDTDNTIAGLQIDTTNSRLYVTDASAGALYGYSTSDGSSAMAAISILGIPNKMSLDSSHLYIANSSDIEAEQVITVVNTTDFTTTQIDLDIPTDDISAISNSTGTVLLTRQSNQTRVLVDSVDTTTFAGATALTAGDDSVTTGELNPDYQLVSAVGGVILSKLSDGTIYGTISQADGRITTLTITSDLASFTAESTDTTTSLLGRMELLVDTSNNGRIVYIPSAGTGDLLFEDVGDPDSLDAF